MKEFYSFYHGLFMHKSYVYHDDFALMMAFIFLSAFGVLAGMFALLKRQSKLETAAILWLPAIFAITGGFVETGITGAIFGTELDGGLHIKLMYDEYLYALLKFFGVYFVLAVIFIYIENKKMERKTRTQKIVCFLRCFGVEGIYVLIISAVFFYDTSGGNLIYYMEEQYVKYIFYGLLMIFFKVMMMAATLLLYFYTTQIRIKWKERKNLRFWLFVYLLICDNSYLRCAVLYISVIFGLYIGMVYQEPAMDIEGYFIIFFVLAGYFFIPLIPVFLIWRTCREIAGGRMGNEYCREFLSEYMGERLWDNEMLVLTQHYLIIKKRIFQVCRLREIEKVRIFGLTTEIYAAGKYYTFENEWDKEKRVRRYLG